MHDTAMLEQINTLIQEEEAFYELGFLDDNARRRLAELRVRLDQIWDFLRHRRAYLAFMDVVHAAPARETYYQ
jgi:DNA-binding transcriptional regulator PaaX